MSAPPVFEPPPPVGPVNTDWRYAVKAWHVGPFFGEWAISADDSIVLCFKSPDRDTAWAEAKRLADQYGGLAIFMETYGHARGYVE
jgi:hypothetical protein